MKLFLMNSSENLIYITFSFIKTNSIEALEHILIAILVYLLVCLSIYKVLFGGSSSSTESSSNNENSVEGDGARRRSDTTSALRRFSIKLVSNIKFPRYERILVIISHPDDECMFFGPTIRSLIQRDNNCQLYILCLSNGNYYKKAKVRRLELFKSCTTLGVEESNIILVNATVLPDDPNSEWKIDSVAKIILKTVECLDIEAIVTFDRDGVSQHPNHCAVYYATASLCLAQLLPKDCKIYTLDSINTARKYISIFDLICTFLMSTNWCIINWKEASVIRSAMKEHKSQMLWFRWLYILFSRYIFINSLREMNLSDIELEMQIQDS